MDGQENAKAQQRYAVCSEAKEKHGVDLICKGYASQRFAFNAQEMAAEIAAINLYRRNQCLLI